MTRYYKKYLPYIIFFSTFLIGGVTILTASHLTKTPEEGESVVPTDIEAYFDDRVLTVCDMLAFSVTGESKCENQVETHIGICDEPGTTDLNPIDNWSIDYKIQNVHKGGSVNPDTGHREYYTIRLVYEELSFHCDEKWGENVYDHCRVCFQNKELNEKTVTLESGEEATGTISRNNDAACGTFQSDIATKWAYLSIWDDDDKVWTVRDEPIHTNPETTDCWNENRGVFGIVRGAVCRTGIDCGAEQPFCGDGNIDSEAGETCDDGDPNNGGTNGTVCNPETSENGYCSYCNSSCQIENLATCDALDLNQDMVINIDDVTIVSNCSIISDSVPADCENYNLDFNSDGVIDIADIAIVSARVGEVCSENNTPICGLVSFPAAIKVGNTSTINVSVEDEDSETVTTTTTIVPGADGVNGTITPENYSEITAYSYDATYTGTSVGTDLVKFTVSDGKSTSECSTEVVVTDQPNNQPFCEGLTSTPSRGKVAGAYPRDTIWSFSCSGVDDDEGDSITGYEYTIEKSTGEAVDVIQCLKENGVTPTLVTGSVGNTSCLFGNNINTLEGYRFSHENSYNAKCRVRDDKGIWSDTRP